MKIRVNKLYAPVLTTKCRYIHIWGGRGRGASHFATDYFLMLITAPKYFRGGFVRSTFGEIKTGLYRAFKDRAIKADSEGDVKITDFKFNETELTVTYLPTGNSIISKGLKKSNLNQAANLKGLEGLTHLIIEEAEDSNEDDIDKLDDTLRTVLVENIQILFLFNPPHKNHYLIKRNYDLVPANATDVLGNEIKGWYKAIPKNNPELLSIHGTYRDNAKNLNESNKRKNYNYGNPNSPYYNPDKYCRDVEGLVSEGKRGRIFHNVQSMPIALFNSLPYPSFYGLDFGFNDPNAVVECKYRDGKLFLNELIYESGLDNDELAKRMKLVHIDKSRKVYADSARPDNIKSLNKYGFIVIGADKGPGSIEYGYRELLNVKIYYTDTSKNLESEIELHSWELDKDKEPTDVPEDDNNHLLDGARYAYTMHVKKRSPTASAPNDHTNDWEKWTDPGYSDREITADDIAEFYESLQ